MLQQVGFDGNDDAVHCFLVIVTLFSGFVLPPKKVRQDTGNLIGWATT